MLLKINALFFMFGLNKNSILSLKLKSVKNSFKKGENNMQRFNF